jgi:hypothetical protein
VRWQPPAQLRYVLTPAQQDLAGWLLQHERAVDGHHTPDGPLGPTEQVLRKLSPGVTALVTTAGYRALLARALHLARARFPSLEGVQVSNEGTFLEASPAVIAAAVDESLAALIGTVIALLVTFVGDDLTSSLIRGAWPDAPLRHAEPGSGGKP